MSFKKITVAGGGVLGSQIAFQSAYCGFDVTIYILSGEEKEEIMDKVTEDLEDFGQTE
jgi:3-hydroxybutyryl-CoA dehydrogenase